MKRCPYCEVGVPDNATVCPVCGHTLIVKGDAHGERPLPKSHLFHHLGRYLGDDATVTLSWKSLFVDAFKRHSVEEAEELFIYGTAKTTPSFYDITSHWPKPWLYLRVLLVFLVAFACLTFGVFILNSSILIPDYVVIGSMMMPLAMIVLLYEMNVWRNVSIFSTVVVFLIGGGASIIASLILFGTGINSDISTYLGALGTGFIEETGKAIIVYLVLRYFVQHPTILNGLLLGGAVGAGFAAFESAGYAFNADSMSETLQIIFIRSILSPGGHVAWAAISGAAIVMAANHKAISTKCFISSTFWKIFIIPILLHMLWDAPLMSQSNLIWGKYIALLIFAWIVLLLLVDIGLDEVSNVVRTFKKHHY